MEVYIPALLGNYDRSTVANQVTLPIIYLLIIVAKDVPVTKR